MPYLCPLQERPGFKGIRCTIRSTYTVAAQKMDKDAGEQFEKDLSNDSLGM